MLSVLAQANMSGLVHQLGLLLIIAIIVGAMLWIAQDVLHIPANIMNVIYVLVGVVCAVLAIYFLMSLV